MADPTPTPPGNPLGGFVAEIETAAQGWIARQPGWVHGLLIAGAILASALLHNWLTPTPATPAQPAAPANLPTPNPVVSQAAPADAGAELFLHRKVLKGRLQAHVVREATAHGLSPAEAVQKLGDGTLLQWFVTNGPEIVKFIELLISLIAML